MKLHYPAIIAGLLLAAAGCSSQQSDPKDFFYDEGPSRDVHRIAEVQSARGARSDAMLYETHFDGTDLNSLGRAKLDLMLRDNERKLPLVVYLSFAGEPKSRQESVEAYLRDSGVRADQVRFENGVNPNATGSAAESIKALEAQQLGGQPVPVMPGAPSVPTAQ